ncbi:hypothetical protein T11_17059 [Trichinella zimbabwensis]|uniref:Uncharacterized protein n=1 Tax=Trichinella zimbabwensis TaxID=268475 RepID=A0A0V1H0L3_9BILA|nr:hypothetical protein T11_17059 [Trichinella zimbabwensis]
MNFYSIVWHTCLQLQRIHSKRYTLTEQYCVFSGKNDDKISEIVFSTTNVGYCLVAKIVALYLNSGYGALLYVGSSVAELAVRRA